MPEYDYLCEHCEKKFAVYLSLWKLDEKTAVTCPHCQSDKVKKLVTGFFAKTSKKS